MTKREVTVRMYNVGFGDAFLIFVPTTNKKTLRILVDCGSIAAGPHDMSDIVAKIIGDITDSDGVARLDLVVATHRHRDHVSGFANDAWDEVEVREVWLPWTEDPNDPQARKIVKSQASLAFHLSHAFASEGESDERYMMAMNALANEKAMETLHSGFAGSPIRRFLPSKADTSPLRIDGVMFHVVGPTFSEDAIRDMDPPAGQSYLAVVSESAPGQQTIPLPFDEFWTWVPDPRSPPLSDQERAKIDQASALLSEVALTSLESAVNGTSLFFSRRVGEVNFVFPGDAQWGTWKAVLDNPKYRAMLKSTRFYKIGHHGSHNATPVDFVEALEPGVLSMASVRPISKWKDIPRKPLLEELGKTGEVVRSDELETLDRNHRSFSASSDWYVEARIPTDSRDPRVRTPRAVSELPLSDCIGSMLGTDGGRDLTSAGPASLQLMGVVGNESVTRALIARSFWHAYLHGTAWGARPRAQLVWRAGRFVREPADGIEVCIAAQRTRMGPGRFDLVIFDPRAREPRVEEVRPDPHDLARGWMAMSAPADPALAALGQQVAIEAASHQDFRLLVLPMGELEATASVPNPSRDSHNTSRGTLGVVAQLPDGRHVATLANHTVDPTAVKARCCGIDYEIVSRSETLDACLVDISGFTLGLRPVRGARMRPPPNQIDVEFESVITQEVKRTTLVGSDPNIGFDLPGVQHTIWTDPITNPGDSGAALISRDIDSDGDVLGFAFVRSELGRPGARSLWIWAGSVFSRFTLT